MTSAGRRIVTAGSAFATGSALLTVVNRLTTPSLGPGTDEITETVAVCIPARNEAERLPHLIADLRQQIGVENFHVTVYDDLSTDGTATRASAAAQSDARFTILRGTASPPPGWLGKSSACAHAVRHADTHDPDVIVFVDADVRLGPRALSAAVTELRRTQAALLSPWPVQLARTPAERLVQPLLCWSWAATLPIALANLLRTESTVVACGQFLVFDAPAYRRLGGHAAVAGSVTEDLALARALRRRGGRTVVAAAGTHARCRMYSNARHLQEGYGKWLWSAFGSRSCAAAVLTVAAVTWILPAVALARPGRSRTIGALGYGAGVASRMIARTLETRRRPTWGEVVDAAAHPVSVLAAIALTVSSRRDRRLGRTRWKGRTISSAQTA